MPDGYGLGVIVRVFKFLCSKDVSDEFDGTFRYFSFKSLSSTFRKKNVTGRPRPCCSVLGGAGFHNLGPLVVIASVPIVQ